LVDNFHARLPSYRLNGTLRMTFRQSTLRLIPKAMLVTAVVTTVVACGDPKYQAPAIVVTFFSPPPTSIDTDSTVEITAVVANDPQNAGVNFTCVPAGVCGSFNPAQIASNVPTCYQAPAQVPVDTTVTITATSVTDTTKSVASAPITILNGAPVQPCAP